MGTNYYYIDRDNEMTRRHLGKSSVGWAYALRVWPEAGLMDLDSWVSYMERGGGCIYDEYKRKHTLDEWLSVVRDRWFTKDEFPDEVFLRQNHAELRFHPEGDGLLLFSEGFSDRPHGPTWEAVDSDFS
jgi:hypothetical protein